MDFGLALNTALRADGTNYTPHYYARPHQRLFPRTLPLRVAMWPIPVAVEVPSPQLEGKRLPQLCQRIRTAWFARLVNHGSIEQSSPEREAVPSRHLEMERRAKS